MLAAMDAFDIGIGEGGMTHFLALATFGLGPVSVAFARSLGPSAALDGC
jgi:hypothetical protein